MFDELKFRLMHDELDRIRAAESEPHGCSEFAAEVSQRQAFLSLHDSYQQKLEIIQLNLEKEQENNRRLNDELMRLATQRDFELTQARNEAQQMRKYHEVELLYCSNEIQKLKTLVISLKGGKDATSLQRSLRGEVAALQQKIGWLENGLEQKQRQTMEIRNEKNTLAMELLKVRDERTNKNTNIQAEMVEYRMKYESAERNLKELEVRLRLSKEQVESKDKQLELIRSTANELEEKHERKLRQLNENYEHRLSTLDSENRRMSNELARLTSELNCQQTLSSRYQEEIRQTRELVEAERQRPQQRQSPRTEPKKADIRARSEDPEKESNSKKQESTREIIIQPEARQRTSNSHHCRCRYVDRYRSKLGEANEKIMQLLTEKCKMKLELGHLRRWHQAELTVLEATADLDNIVIL